MNACPSNFGAFLSKYSMEHTTFDFKAKDTGSVSPSFQKTLKTRVLLNQVVHRGTDLAKMLIMRKLQWWRRGNLYAQLSELSP